MTTKFVFNPFTSNFDLVTASISPSDITGGAPNTVAGFDGTGALYDIPGWAIDVNSGGLSQSITIQPNNVGGNLNINTINTNVDPLQNSPNDSSCPIFINVNLDVNNNGFSYGTNGTATNLLALSINHQGSSDIGNCAALSISPNFGNGTDAFTMDGWAYALGFGNINANVTIDGSIQGWGFQPAINAAAIGTNNFSVRAFYDNSNTNIPVHGYDAFSSGPNIASMANNSNYNGLNINPTIPTFTGNAGMTGVAVGGNLGTIGTNGYQGVSVNPVIATAGANNVVGLNVSMSNVTGTNVKAITTDAGLVNFNNSNLKNGDFGFAASSQINTSTTGTLPATFGQNQIGGALVIDSGFPITGGQFGFGNNLGIVIDAQDDMDPDGSGLGLGYSINGFVTTLGAAAGKTFDTLNFMAAGASNGIPGSGNFTNVNMFRALGVVPGGGSATITNMIGFKVESVLSALNPTNTWGFFCDDVVAENYLAKSLAIGTATKKVSVSTTGLEIAGKDLVVDNGDVQITDFAAAGVVLNNASGVLSTLAPGTAGNILTSTGSAWISSAPVSTGTPPTMQQFLSGSGTYTTPASVQYIRVRIVAGGGGGAGSGAVATPGTNGSPGTDSTFGTELTCEAGDGGLADGTGGDGGSANVINSPAFGFNPPGNPGGTGSLAAITTGALPGGMGGSSFWGGAGKAGSGGSGVAATAGTVNTGSGGGGASPNTSALSYAGGGGGAGGYIDAIIPSPNATYSYSVGTGGAAGTAGTGGNAGGAGGSGYIIVEEFY